MSNTPPSSRPRGRPKVSDDDRAAMRATIEATALRLFQSEGYEAISMRRLALELACSPMTLYGYFDSKISILRAIWDQIFDDLFARLMPHIGAAVSPEAWLHRLAWGYVDYWLCHPDHYRMVFMSADVSQAEVSVFLSGSPALERMAGFRAALAAACQPPARPEDLAERGDLLLSGLHGIAHCHITMSGYPWVPADTQVRRLVQLLITR